MLVLYNICLFVSLISIFIKNKKMSIIIGLSITVAVVSVMINANDNCLDLLNYRIRYDAYSNSNIRDINGAEIGYKILAIVCSKLRLSFIQFRAVVFLICFTLILRTLLKYTNNIPFFMTFYMLHSMFLDGEQLRNFIAFSIIIYAIPFLVEKNKKSNIKYVICILFASFFHTMALFYLTLLVINISKDLLKKWIKAVPIIVVIVIFIVLKTNLLANILLVLSNLLEDSISDKVLVYAGTKARLGFLTPIIIYFSYCFFIMYINKNYLSNEVDIRLTKLKEINIGKNTIYIKDNNSKIDFYQQICNINYIGLLFLPLFVLSLTFYRLVRNICLLDLVYFASIFEKVSSKKKKIIILFVVLALIMSWRVFDFNLYSDWDLFYQTYFEN